MLLIYVQKITPRIRYVMQLYFGELIRTEFEITDDANRFQSFHGARLNYSQRRFMMNASCLLRTFCLNQEFMSRKFHGVTGKGFPRCSPVNHPVLFHLILLLRPSTSLRVMKNIFRSLRISTEGFLIKKTPA